MSKAADGPLMTEVIAECNDFPGLLAALQKRVASIRTTYSALDALSGLTDGYVQKCLQRVPERRMGLTALGPLLGALGLKLIVAVDEAQWEKVKHRLTSTKRGENWGQRAGGQRATPPVKKRPPSPHRGDTEWGRRMQALQMVLLTPKFRQRAARKAGRMSAIARRKIRDKLLNVSPPQRDERA